MPENIENPGLGKPAHDHKVPIPVRNSLVDERIVELAPGQSVTVILEIIAKERGCGIEELILVREGHDAPLTELILIDADYPHRHRHHVHHVSEVKVTVYYQAEEHSHTFKRSATVEDILAWGIKVFSIDTSMATEFELTRHGQKEELPGTEHIGHLTGHHHELALDLVRGDIANGAWS